MKLTEVLTGPETWCKGVEVNSGRRCFMRAALVAYPDREMFLDVVEVAHNVVRERWGTSRGAFTEEWNDHPDTTWDDVAWLASEVDRRMIR